MWSMVMNHWPALIFLQDRQLGKRWIGNSEALLIVWNKDSLPVEPKVTYLFVPLAYVYTVSDAL